MSGFSANDLAFFGFPSQPAFSGSSLTGDANAFFGGSGGTGSQYWKFMTPPQQQRLEKIRAARMLFNDQHRKYFLDELRSQFSYPDVRIGGIWGDQVQKLYITNNILGLISRKGADLLFGDEAVISVDAPKVARASLPVSGTSKDTGKDARATGKNTGKDARATTYTEVQEELQRAFLADLIKRCDLAALWHQGAENASCDGAAFFEVMLVDEGEGPQVWLTDVPAEEIFPVGAAMANGQYRQYDRFTLGQQPSADPKAQPIFLLLITHYKVGVIERELWKLFEGGKQERLDLSQWPDADPDNPMVPSTPTGLSVNTVVYVPNQIRHKCAMSDYGHSAIQLQDRVNAKETQLAYVIAKHASPILSRLKRHAEQDGNMGSEFNVEYNDDQAQKSQYITWDAQLAIATKDRDLSIMMLLVQCESSPSLLGINLGGETSHATAFKSFRLMASNAIAKAQRKANYWRAGIARMLDVCCRMAQTIPGTRFEIYPVSVTLRDGIPQDGLEEAQRIAALRTAGVISVKRAVSEQISDPGAAAAEIEELQEEDDARPDPPIPGAGPGGPGAPGGSPVIPGPAPPAPGAVKDAAQDNNAVAA